MAYSVWQAFITDAGEQVVPGATASVFKESDGSPATLYDGPAGAPIGWSVVSSADGLARFFVAGGTYKIVATKGAFTKEFRHVQLGDSASRDVVLAPGGALGYEHLGVVGGAASLDGAGKVPSAQLPSYVDDVEEYADFASLPVIGETGKIYVTLDDNKSYRWSGATYIAIGQQTVYQYANLAAFPVSGEAGVLYIAADSGVVYRWTGSAYQIILSSLFGVANGAATLAADGKHTETEIRRYMYANTAAFPPIGAEGAICIAEDTNKIYRHVSAGTYAELSAGLAYLTESRTTAAPNATVPVHGITASGAEANIDLLLAPKGTGALVLDIPDSAATGGNKRGNNAIDLQSARSAADRVASGNSSVAVGANNRATGNSGSVAIGLNNQVNNGIAIGEGNNNATLYSGCMVGFDNTTGASDSEKTMLVGELNTASSTGDKMAFGRSNSVQKTSYCYGSSNVTTADGGYCYGNNNQSLNNQNYLFGNSNTAQGSGAAAYIFGFSNTCPSGSTQNFNLIFGGTNKVVGAYAAVLGRNGYAPYANNLYIAQILITTDKVSLRREQHQQATTTDATPTVLTVDAAAAANSNTLYFNSNTTAKITGHVIARTAGGDYKVWAIDAVVNKVGAGTLAIPTAAPVTAQDASAGAAAWGVTLTVASDRAIVTATGAAATTIKWLSILEVKELGVQYGYSKDADIVWGSRIPGCLCENRTHSVRQRPQARAVAMRHLCKRAATRRWQGSARQPHSCTERGRRQRCRIPVYRVVLCSCEGHR